MAAYGLANAVVADTFPPEERGKAMGLLSIPLLMLPSILSLAFPDENPALNRAAGDLTPVCRERDTVKPAAKPNDQQGPSLRF